MEEQNIPATGALASEVDPRTVKHEFQATAVLGLISGGSHYTPEEIEHQHRVGICTAISRVQMREMQTGKKYSPDFQYLLQKKFVDGNWQEGSSPLSSNKVAKNYGFLPIELFTYVSEADRYMDYASYINKLKSIPDSEVQRLIGLCVDKIAGYAQVNHNDPQAIAHAIMNSPKQSGILCRYGCQKNWWTAPDGRVSWQAKDIEVLRPAPETSGHQVINSFFDFNNGSLLEIPNTWGTQWCRNGLCFINWDNYPMNEAWVDLPEAPIIPPYVFTKVLRLGSQGFDVKQLQKKLNIPSDGFFGIQTKNAVIAFQKAHGLAPDGIVGNNTNAALNK